MTSEAPRPVISHQHQWDRVAADLVAENLKPAAYDNTLVPLLGDMRGKKILDYGCGPGVLATALQRLGADVQVYDVSPEMRQQAAEKIGEGNVFASTIEIPQTYYNFIICNLVLCIVEEPETRLIASNIVEALQAKGAAYIGFCNPRIYDVRESNLDLRPSPQVPYEVNHDYKKTKKEGGYQIIERHRPLEWYEQMFREAGFRQTDLIFTPQYHLNGRDIQDFTIFRLEK
jgi:ubiquinone/menaquinone biosynthesis C-methylase UbiE